MNHHSGTVLILLATILASGLFAVQSSAASISKPSVPQFTVSNASNGDIVIIIVNQPIEGSNGSLYYQVRTKNYDSNDWEIIEVYRIEESGYWSREPYQKASSGQYTILSINTEIKQEFQVQALIGNLSAYNDHALDLFNALTTYIFHGESSDWSAAQSADGKIYTPEPTPQPFTPNTTPQQTSAATPQATYKPPEKRIEVVGEINWNNVALTMMALAIAFLAGAVIALWRRMPKQVA